MIALGIAAFAAGLTLGVLVVWHLWLIPERALHDITRQRHLWWRNKCNELSIDLAGRR